MKKLYFLLFSLFSVAATAQIYTPSNTTQGTSGNQNVGIGTNNPQGKLHVRTSSEVGIVIDINQLAGGPALGEPGENNTATSPPVYPFEILYTNNNLPGVTNIVNARWHATGRLDLGSDFNGFPIPTNSRLNVTNAIGVYGNANEYAYIQNNSLRWYNNGTGAFTIAHGDATNSSQTNFFTLMPNGFAAIGNVGLNGPQAALHVVDNRPESSTAREVYGLLVQNNGFRNHDYALKVQTGHGTVFTVGNFGTVHIGDGLNRNIPDGEYRLWVEGGIRTEKVKVDIASVNGWADYVFAEDYVLMPIEELEAFIKENKHLPGVPSAEEVVENGVELAEMNKILLEKIEELTLRLIELEKRTPKP
jgi:hypothetical protein